MKKILMTCAVFILSAGSLLAQTEISAFTATGGAYSTTFLTDYQCLGINPANLGWTRNDHKMNLGLGEGTVSIYSEPLTRKEVFNDLFNDEDWLDTQGKKDAAKKFTDTRLLGIGAWTWVGFSYQDEKIGGIAFNIRERLMWNSSLNEKAASFLFTGWRDPYFDQKITNQYGDTIEGISSNSQYASTVYKGTDQHLLHIREFNLGYGRKLLEIDDDVTWYGGFAVKYLLGFAGVQYYQNENGELMAFSALSPIYDVDYNTPTPSAVSGSGMKKVGSGFGFDIGTTFRYKNLKIGIAVNDIGSIKWDGNVYEGNDVRVYSIETEGMNNYNIFEQGELIVSDNHPDDPNEWTGLENKTVKLPMNLRGGASYRIMEALEVGVDLYVPLGDKVPGYYDAVVFGLGTHYDPAPWIQLSLGLVSKGDFGVNIPMGVTFFPVNNEKRTWSMGLGTGDMITWFSDTDPTVALCFGVLRFSFGEK